MSKCKGHGGRLGPLSGLLLFLKFIEPTLLNPMPVQDLPHMHSLRTPSMAPLPIFYVAYLSLAIIVATPVICKGDVGT